MLVCRSRYVAPGRTVARKEPPGTTSYDDAAAERACTAAGRALPVSVASMQRLRTFLQMRLSKDHAHTELQPGKGPF